MKSYKPGRYAFCKNPLNIRFRKTRHLKYYMAGRDHARVFFSWKLFCCQWRQRHNNLSSAAPELSSRDSYNEVTNMNHSEAEPTPADLPFHIPNQIIHLFCSTQKWIAYNCLHLSTQHQRRNFEAQIAIPWMIQLTYTTVYRDLTERT